MTATRDAPRPASGAGGPKAPYEKLSPGPGMPASEVGAHQRSRFHNAMVELVTERGYAKIAVHDLVAVAKVSSRAFYEQFDGKEDCFLRTRELVVRRIAKRVIAAQAGERDWRERLRLGFKAFVRELEREPQAARLALVETCLDGLAVQAQTRKAELLFGAMLADSFSRAPDGPPVTSATVEAIVAGIAAVARRHVLSGKRRVPPRLADELMEWALTCRDRAAVPLAMHPPISSRKPTTEESGPGTSDRDLSLAAVVKLATAGGYAHLTVPRIRAAAGISRQRFDAEFGGVDDCLSAARDERLASALADARHARDSVSGMAGTTAAVLALCARFADDPVLARLCFAVDCVGPRCLAEEGPCGTRAVDRVAEALYGEKAAKRPSVAIQASAGLVWTTIGTRALSKRQDALQRVAPLLTALA